jgi:ferrous iron transport protein B
MGKALVIGSPNSGKSLLFNRLTGLSHKVANFPGITVDVGYGRVGSIPDLVLYDYPGTYSLQAITGEEQVAVDRFREALHDPELRLVLCVMDITRLEKSLHLCLQVLRECARHNKPALVVANMIDVLERHKISIDLAGLEAAIGAPLLPVSARTGRGMDTLLARMRQYNEGPVAEAVPSRADNPDAILRGEAHSLSQRFSPRGDILIRNQTRLDSFLLHTVTGGVAFFAIMYLLFQSIFTWSAPAMDAVEASLGWLAGHVVPSIGHPVAADFVADALFSGIGAFLVFVPQIFVLTFVIGLLEDSGYMARAALICHRPLRLFGLTGKSFIPMLSGVACAIPGIYAARSVDSPRKRLLTYLAIPLMPCSARLPVYTLLIAAFVPRTTALGGLVGWQGLAMFGVYFFGMFTALLVTALVSHSRQDRFSDLPFVLEMPPYRLPSIGPLLSRSANRAKLFVTKAGAIIFTVTLVIWVLGYFPNYGSDLGASWLGQLGHWIQPLFAPLGLDWRYGVAILTSFLAREVFVGTLGTLFGIEGAEDNMVPLVSQVQASGLPVASGLALLVFFSIALMCVSTMAVLSRESRSTRLALQMFLAYGALAYASAWAMFELVSALAG